jgi:hypothetical protein
MGKMLSGHWHDSIWVGLRYLTYATSALLVLALIGHFALHKVTKHQAAIMVVVNLICYAALLARGAMVKDL